MITAAVTSMVTNAMGHMSADASVWIELVFAGVAAMLYYIISARSATTICKTASTSREEVPRDEPRNHVQEKELTSAQLALKAMRQGRMNEAIAFIQHSPDAIRRVPFDLACKLLLTLARLPKLNMAADLKVLTGKISSQALEAAVVEAMKANDVVACRQLHVISGLLSIAKKEQTFETLAKIYACDAVALRALVGEARTPLARPFAEVALTASLRMEESTLVAEIFEKVTHSDAASLRGMVEKATATKEGDVGSMEVESLERSTSPDASAEIHHQQDLKDTTLGSMDRFHSRGVFEIARRANDIRSCGKNKDFKGAVKIFDRLGNEANITLIVNSMLEACVECNEIDKAVDYFHIAKRHNIADIGSYTAMMNGYIARGQEAEQKNLLSELTEKGLSPLACFHGVLSARVDAREFGAAWKLVAEMQAAGIPPNAATCSILLEGKMSSTSDVSRTLALIDAMDEPMDEALFLSVVQACIRTGGLDLLSRQTEKFLQQSPSASFTAPTYGAMIKAYGHARDVKRIWHLWEQMLSHDVQPTCVTLGCMVEALVANGRSGEAWKLAQGMWKDESTRSLVNSVIYARISNGDAHTKETEQGTLREETKGNDPHGLSVTYNSILNAFAQDKKVDRAFQVLGGMKASGKHAPEGRAEEHHPDEGSPMTDMKKFRLRRQAACETPGAM